MIVVVVKLIKMSMIKLKRPDLTGMGATLTALLISQFSAFGSMLVILASIN